MFRPLSAFICICLCLWCLPARAQQLASFPAMTPSAASCTSPAATSGASVRQGVPPLEGPGLPSCNLRPTQDAMDYSSQFVLPPRTMLDAIADACDPISGAADSFAALGETLTGASTWSTVGAKGADFLVKAESLLKKTMEAAGGVELYLARCSGNAVWDGLLRPMASSLRTPQALHESSQKTIKDATDLLAKVKAMKEAGTTPTREEILAVVGTARSFYGDANKTVKAASDVEKGLRSLSSAPQHWVPNNSDAVTAAAQAEQVVGGVLTTCRVPEAERILNEATSLSIPLLTSANLAYARAHQEETEYRETLIREHGQKYTDDLEIAGGGTSAPTEDERNKWAAFTNATTKADAVRTSTRGALISLGQLCEQLKKRAVVVQQKWEEYLEALNGAKADIEACRVDAAREKLAKIDAFEKSECAQAMISRPQGGPLSAMVPWSQIPSSPGTVVSVSGTDLRTMLTNAETRCGGTKAPSPADDLPKGTGVWVQVSAVSDPGHSSEHRLIGPGDAKRQDETWQLSMGSYVHKFRTCEWCADVRHANASELLADNEQTFTFDNPPPVIDASKTGSFTLRIKGTAVCKAIRNNQQDCGFAKARFEGPGAKLIELTRMGQKSDVVEDGLSAGFIWGTTTPNTSSEAVYIFPTANLPNEFDILQIGSGAGVAGKFHYCKDGKC
jgi:hypothetical protein